MRGALGFREFYFLLFAHDVFPPNRVVERARQRGPTRPPSAEKMREHLLRKLFQAAFFLWWLRFGFTRFGVSDVGTMRQELSHNSKSERV